MLGSVYTCCWEPSTIRYCRWLVAKYQFDAQLILCPKISLRALLETTFSANLRPPQSAWKTEGTHRSIATEDCQLYYSHQFSVSPPQLIPELRTGLWERVRRLIILNRILRKKLFSPFLYSFILSYYSVVTQELNPSPIQWNIWYTLRSNPPFIICLNFKNNGK